MILERLKLSNALWQADTCLSKLKVIGSIVDNERDASQVAAATMRFDL